MNTVPTDPKKRRLAAILFAAAAGMQLLYIITSFIDWEGEFSPVIPILYLLLYAVIAAALFLSRIPFPVAGAGLGCLGVVSLIDLIVGVRAAAAYVYEFDNSWTGFYSPGIDFIRVRAYGGPIVRLLLTVGILTAAAILLLTVFGKEGLKEKAKKAAVIPFVILLAACVLELIWRVLTGVRFGFLPNALPNLCMLAADVLLMLGTANAVRAYTHPDGV